MKNINIKNIILEEITNTTYGNVCDIFLDKTNVPDYDDILNNNKRVKENVIGKIIQMSPHEYIDRCAKLQNTSYNDQIKLINKNKVSDIIKTIKSGEKLNLPYIDYDSSNQEGRHRVMASLKLGCGLINVAIFLSKNQEDPYVSNNDSNENNLSLENMYGKSVDVKVDDNNDYYIEYDANKTKDILKFVKLYPKFKSDIFKSDIEWKLIQTIFEGNDLNNNHFFYIPTELFMNDKENQTINNFLLNQIQNSNCDFEQYGIEPLNNNNFYELVEYIQIINRDCNKLQELSKYLTNMMNSVYAYLFFEKNKNYFENIDNKKYNVFFDLKNKKIRLYSDDNYSKLYNEAKISLMDDNIILSNNQPFIPKLNRWYLLPMNLIKEYIKKYNIFNINLT